MIWLEGRQFSGAHFQLPWAREGDCGRPSSLSDLNVKSLISLEFMFLISDEKTKLNNINMLSITPTSSPTGC